jgi:tetratricopeptide (TPR) repeat protein
MLGLGGVFIKVPDGSDDFKLSPEERRNLALQWTRRAHATLAELCTSFPRFPLYRLELAKSHNSLANAFLQRQEFEQARAEFENAHTVLDELEQDFPDFVLNLADYASTRGVVFGCLGAFEQAINHDPEAARPLLERAIQHQRRASEIAPENPSFLMKLAGHYAFLATIVSDLGHQQQADEMRQKAAEVKAEAVLREAIEREAD